MSDSTRPDSAESGALVEVLTHALHSTETASGWYGEPECADVANVLAPHVMVLLAQAWGQGYASGHSNAMRRMSDEPDAPTSPNPYRLTSPGNPS